LVVVVSEESGAVSYAYRGTLVRGITLENLRAFLTSVLVEPRPRSWRGTVRDLFRGARRERLSPCARLLVPMAWHRPITHNLGWKIVSALLGPCCGISCTSAARTRSGSARETFDAVPIHVLTAAGEAGAFEVDPPSVRLTVSGTSEALRRLRLSDVLVFVNLGNIQDVEAYREVEVHLPGAVALNALVPNQVRVTRRDPKPLTSASPEP
jgi:hypothetical protein